MTHPARFVGVLSALLAFAFTPVLAQPAPPADAAQTAALFAACTKTSVDADDACYRGLLVASGVEPNSKAIEPSSVGWLGEEACDHSHWRSCLVYADLLKRGFTVPKNEGRSVALLQAACRGEFFHACELLDDIGVVHEAAGTVPPRPGWVKEPKPELLAPPQAEAAGRPAGPAPNPPTRLRLPNPQTNAPPPAPAPTLFSPVMLGAIAIVILGGIGGLVFVRSRQSGGRKPASAKRPVAKPPPGNEKIKIASAKSAKSA